MRKPYTRWQRLLGFGLSLAVILLLAACGAAKTAKTNAAAKSAASIAPEKNASVDGEERGAVESPADEAIGGFYGSPELGGGFDFHYASGDAPVAPGAPGVDGEGSDPGTLPTGTAEPDLGEAFVLTAAEWNDNENWPFFTNLVNAGAISFPSFGIDPRNRIVVTLTDAAGAPLGNEPVRLKDADGAELWTARTDKNGTAYLFFGADQTPDLVEAGGVSTPVNVQTPDGSGQGTTVTARAETLTVTGTASAAAPNELQVMFLVDTTGSMADEISYLQKDFSAIAEDAGSSGIRYAACFYRDEGDDYVTRMNPFTSDVSEVQVKINSEYADGGGDNPEAVAPALTEAVSADQGWSESAEKLLFLIFDAPPHDGTEAALDAAIRSAAAQGIRVIPVVASNADRATELFGRAAAIVTNGTYVFLTDDSGVGGEHLEPIVGSYDVELLHDVIVRIINEHRPG